MKYKNYGLVSQEFYGVTFRPGETHDVPGFITAKNFVAVQDDAAQPKRKVGRPAKTSSESTPASQREDQETKDSGKSDKESK